MLDLNIHKRWLLVMLCLAIGFIAVKASSVPIRADEWKTTSELLQALTISPGGMTTSASGTIGIAQINSKPTSLVIIREDGRTITIKPDGTVDLAGIPTDEASLAFWKAVGQLFKTPACP